MQNSTGQDFQTPSWLYKHCSDEELMEISLTVKRAESKTSGEIVPMIVSSSAPRTFIPALLFLVLVIFILVGAGPVYESFWISPSLLNQGPLYVCAALLSWFIGNSNFLLRFLTPQKELKRFVQRRAQFEFYEASIQKTEASTGILIFVSLAERQVVILGDENISKHISQDEWVSLVENFVLEIKRGHFAQGMCKSVVRAGEILEKFFPRKPVDFNELPNHLIVKD